MFTIDRSICEIFCYLQIPKDQRMATNQLTSTLMTRVGFNYSAGVLQPITEKITARKEIIDTHTFVDLPLPQLPTATQMSVSLFLP